MTSTLDQIDESLRRTLRTRRFSWFTRPRALLWGFIGLHLLFFAALAPTIVSGGTLGDLPLYREWAMQGWEVGYWQGIDVPWVYPIGAMLPIGLSNILGAYMYQFVWFLITTALNGAAIWVLTDRGRRIPAYKGAWWFLLITLILSPVALLRLEGITAPLVVMGLVWLGRRPVVATLLLTLATWIKVWPAAVILAALAAVPRRATVFVTGALASVGVAATVWSVGGLANLTSFLTVQSDRALQLEAPVTTPWVWLAVFGIKNTTIYENTDIATREVIGPYSEIAASLMDPLMIIAFVTVLTLVVWARRRGAPIFSVLLYGSLALAVSLVLFNKVGSPQYMLWLTPIVAVGIADSWRRWRVAAYLLTVIGLLTTLIFPIFYLPLADGDPAAALLLTARNALVVVLMGWAVVQIVRVGIAARLTRPTSVSALVTADAAASPSPSARTQNA
ncbi:glycosyltransferase 87 family protein [Compostimonas suwonensis]|uniref:Uncharacterized protein DUF2029 n=1 Tax=Compostimonas suwonensis TaxID=1048394 RepID=A0A2M9C4E2_9MICO|nr:glycosyltransferase 87 family protein [Compostimonas suwonensis]PJJ65395.1 uncharacterized protein DUF2029 [Compostimonas suwonensis]